MQLVEMLNQMEPFDEKEDFCKKVPFSSEGVLAYEWRVREGEI